MKKTILIAGLLLLASVVGCKKDQDLGPGSKVIIQFSLGTDEAHTHAFYTPIVKVTEWEVTKQGQKGLAGLKNGMTITLSFILDSDPVEVFAVKLTELLGTGCYLGDAVRMFEESPYTFTITVVHKGTTYSQAVSVTPEAPHMDVLDGISGADWKVVVEMTPGKIHAGVGPPATATAVSERPLNLSFVRRTTLSSGS